MLSSIYLNITVYWMLPIFSHQCLKKKVAKWHLRGLCFKKKNLCLTLLASVCTHRTLGLWLNRKHFKWFVTIISHCKFYSDLIYNSI